MASDKVKEDKVATMRQASLKIRTLTDASSSAQTRQLQSRIKTGVAGGKLEVQQCQGGLTLTVAFPIKFATNRTNSKRSMIISIRTMTMKNDIGDIE